MTDVTKIGVFPIRDGRVLLCRKKGIDALIALGGKLENGETHEACARRETREEAQCELTNIRPFATFTAKRVDCDGHITLHAYLADLIGEPTPRPGDTIYAFAWVGRDYNNGTYTLPPTLHQAFPELI